jgi:hypothetical protein
MTEDFDEGAVAGRARIGHHDAEERTFLGTCATQTDRNHLTLLNGLQGSNPDACFAARRFVEPAD